MTKTDNTCEQKREEEDSPALKIVLLHRYDDSMTTFNRPEENWLHRPETTQQNKDQQNYSI